jgi:Cft2 family RNA processing exonuclease
LIRWKCHRVNCRCVVVVFKGESIKLDPGLEQACSTDMTKFCEDVEPGNAQVCYHDNTEITHMHSSPVYHHLMTIRYVSQYLGHDTIHITIRYDTAALVLLCMELNGRLVVVGVAGPRLMDAWCRRICVCIFVVFP